MLVLVGLTGEVTTVVRAKLLYQVAVPLLQVAVKDELCPEQIVLGVAVMAVGVEGVGLTVTEILPDVLLHPAALTHAT